MKRPGFRKTFAVATTVVLTAALASCAGSEEKSTDTVDLGALIPMSGAFEAQSADYKAAFELYCKLNGDTLGGRKIDVHYEDEGDTPKTSLPSAERLLDKDVDTMFGAASSANFAAVAPETIKAEIPFMGIGGQPDLEKLGIDNEWLWQSATLPNRSGEALAPYMADNVDGSVYVIGPDYEGGEAIVGGFMKEFKKSGGKLANASGQPEWTKWPGTKDFSKYFEEAAQSDAKAIYAFYLGEPAVDFVKQYAKSPASDIPMYTSFVTEEPSLSAEGSAAKGIYSSMIYSPNIDNAANRRFVSEWNEEHSDRPTSMYTMDGWDTALILDQAIGSIPDDEDVTGKKINEALKNLGTVDSPRGTWQFSEETHAPIQKWYLREVRQDGPLLSNMVLEDLDTLDG